MPGDASEPLVCSSCGARAEDAAQTRLTWSSGLENGRHAWTCVGCSRTHLRSIEGRLHSGWW